MKCFELYCESQVKEIWLARAQQKYTVALLQIKIFNKWPSFHGTFSFKQDTILAELLQIHKEHIVGYHEHDSLLDHKEEEELTEEERKAAWAEYEAEKKVKMPALT